MVNFLELNTEKKISILVEDSLSSTKVESFKKFGEYLVTSGLITKQQLKDGLEYQSKYGGKIGWILSSLGYISRLDFFRSLANFHKLEFCNNQNKITALIDTKLIQNYSFLELAENEIIPASLDSKKREVVVFTSNPFSKKVINFLNQHFSSYKVRQIVITDLDLIKTLEHFYKKNFIDRAVHGLFYLSPEFSAARVFSKLQLLIIAGLFYTFLFGIYYEPVITLIVVNIIIQTLYVLSLLFKFVVSISGALSEMEEYITDEDVKNLPEKDLPVYTVLVPVYKEPNVIRNLISCLKKISYPANKLDVIILFEEDDKATLQAAKDCKPPINWRFIIVPDCQPRTKPKACNYGLFFARGKYLTIYDAEDIPEPDQLKKAVVAFNRGGDKYLCFQAALNYFNKDENFLTKMFTLEYSYWFDYLLPGLYNLKLPIPLGGTSNHFDLEKLRSIGGWDPYNTTEDADIGIRAFGKSFKVGVINSTTYEEANSKLKNWLRQRSRWIKGYMQTLLVHSRNIVKLYKSVGLKGLLGFFLLIGGTPISFLVNPIMWFVFCVWLITQTQTFIDFFPTVVLYLSLTNLLVGNFIGVYLCMLSVFKRKYYNLLFYTFLNPIYWMLHSIASYIALYELFIKPFYWQKTEHGLTKYKLNI